MTAAGHDAAATQAPAGGRAEGRLRLWDSRPVRWSAGSGVLLVAGWLLGHLTELPGGVPTGLYVAATVLGIRFFAVEAVEALVADRRVDIELLMTVAALVAGALGLWGKRRRWPSYTRSRRRWRSLPRIGPAGRSGR